MITQLRQERYLVSSQQYMHFRRDGFLIVRGLVSQDDVVELRQHTEDLMQGKLPEQQGTAARSRHGDAVEVSEFGAPPDDLSPAEKANFFLRIHMLHRKIALHEKYLLHPRLLDVLEVLIGPDVSAMQSMLFLKPPGAAGQGWHQDSFYIPTHPDSLCGAWIAIDDVDERNGAMWFSKGSGVEPVYPPCPEIGYGFGDKILGDTKYVKGVSDVDDSRNALSPAADRYDQVLAIMKAGDVAFFNGHVLHRSKQNWTSDRYRRSFVGHYMNARSFTQWAPDVVSDWAPNAFDPVTKSSNGSQILARGDTHLNFAQPRFGTPCAALQPKEERSASSEYAARIIATHGGGQLGCGIATPAIDDD